MSVQTAKKKRPFDLEKKAILVLFVIIVGVFEFFESYLHWTMNASSVVELERNPIQVTGFIIAFSAVIYASVFSQITLNEPKAKRLLAVHLRVGAMGVFMFLFAALVEASWTLVINSNLKPDFQYSFAAAFVTPLGLIGAAFALAFVGMWRLTITELKTGSEPAHNNRYIAE